MKKYLNYHPWYFFSIIYISTMLVSFILFRINTLRAPTLAITLMLLYVFMPAMLTLVMIFIIGNKTLVENFYQRLTLCKIKLKYLGIILLIMPVIMLLSIAISLIFGFSSEQFMFAEEFSIIKGWHILGLLIPLLIAPMFEELAWRGYGIDSLAEKFNLFKTSVLFGVFWSFWHLPPFFVEGVYQNQLWHLGPFYVINFFASVFVVTFIMNWVYFKTSRSIPALMLFHAMLNLTMMLFRAEPITKCISTVLLSFVVLILIFKDKRYFFDTKNIHSR